MAISVKTVSFEFIIIVQILSITVESSVDVGSLGIHKTETVT